MEKRVYITEEERAKCQKVVDAFAFMYGKVEFIVFDMFFGIKSIIPNLFEMLFWDMLEEPFDKLHGRNGFFYVFVIFMAVVMESDGIILRVVVINARCGDNGSTKISTNILDDVFRFTVVWFCIDIKAIVMVLINRSYVFLKESGRCFFSSFNRTVWKALRKKV